MMAQTHKTSAKMGRIRWHCELALQHDKKTGIIETCKYPKDRYNCVIIACTKQSEQIMVTSHSYSHEMAKK